MRQEHFLLKKNIVKKIYAAHKNSTLWTLFLLFIANMEQNTHEIYSGLSGGIYVRENSHMTSLLTWGLQRGVGGIILSNNYF